MTAPTPAPRSLDFSVRKVEGPSDSSERIGAFDAPEPSTVDAGGLSEEEIGLLVFAVMDGSCDLADRDPGQQAWDEVRNDVELMLPSLARIVADREKRARAAAWDEGYSQARIRQSLGISDLPCHNPYRASSAPTEGEQS